MNKTPIGLSLVLAAAVGCSGQEKTDLGVPEPTFYEDVSPILMAKCASCHQEGGIGPFVVDDVEVVQQRASQIAAYTKDRIMPPYLMETGDECGSFDESRALTQEEIVVIGRWANGAKAEGSEVELTLPVLPGLQGATELLTPRFTLEISGGVRAEFDEYRCFPIEMNVDESTFLSSVEVIPGNKSLVHHVIGHIVDPNAMGSMGEQTNAEVMAALDGASPERDGWPCFGRAGEGISLESIPIAWAPGQGVSTFPENTGIPLLPGRVMVVQVHYNLADENVIGQSDQTKIKFVTSNDVQQVGVFALRDLFLQSLGNETPDFLVPGQDVVEYSYTLTREDLFIAPDIPIANILTVGPHMHERGRTLTVEVDNGEGFECQARVGNWDFNWQLTYGYREPVPLTADSRLRITCEYDTSNDSEPVLPGWGTRNEMCLAGLMVGIPMP